MTSVEWGILIASGMTGLVPLVSWMFKVNSKLGQIAAAAGDGQKWTRRVAIRLKHLGAKVEKHEERLDGHDVELAAIKKAPEAGV